MRAREVALRAQLHKIDGLEQTMAEMSMIVVILSTSLKQIIWLVEGTKKIRKEKRNMVGDLFHGWPYPRHFTEISLRQPLIHVKESSKNKNSKLYNHVDNNVTKDDVSKYF